MKLYLMRHGEAVTDTEDSERPLSEFGKSQVLQVAQTFKSKLPEVHTLWHSPKKRAQGTAEIIARAVEVSQIQEKAKGLLPEDSQGAFLSKLDEFKIEHPGKNLMVVGHCPFLPALVDLLAPAKTSGERIQFHLAALVCLESSDPLSWTYAWSLKP